MLSIHIFAIAKPLAAFPLHCSTVPRPCIVTHIFAILCRCISIYRNSTAIQHHSTPHFSVATPIKRFNSIAELLRANLLCAFPLLCQSYLCRCIAPPDQSMRLRCLQDFVGESAVRCVSPLAYSRPTPIFKHFDYQVFVVFVE